MRLKKFIWKEWVSWPFRYKIEFVVRVVCAETVSLFFAMRRQKFVHQKKYFFLIRSRILFYWALRPIRVKTISEQLRVVEKLSCFEITAFFPHLKKCMEKGGNFKTRKFFNYPESFLYCLYSSLHPLIYRIESVSTIKWIKSSPLNLSVIISNQYWKTALY